MVYQPTTGFVNVGEFFVCNCGVRLVKCTAPGVYESLKKDNGRTSTVTCQAIGGTVKIKCNKCERGMDYIHIQEELKIN